MSPTISQQPFRSYRAATQHGAALIDPPLSEVSAIVDQNLRRSPPLDAALGLPSQAEFRKRARQELLDAAIAYSRTYRDVPDSWDTPRDSLCRMPIIMAGHQPELFHPGVWFKNFVLSRLGHRHRSVAINLIVDNDICINRSIRMPTFQGGRWAVENVAFDQAAAVMPYEMAQIADRQTFDRFGANVSERLARLPSPVSGQRPAIDELWPHVKAAANQNSNLGCVLAQGRHRLEQSLGLQTLEVPLSRVCQGVSFTAFMLRLIDDLPRLHACYNESVREYRVAHGIRSTSHPVPELGQHGTWFEVPFWIYDRQRPQRRALLAQRSGKTIALSDGDAWQIQISVPDAADPASVDRCHQQLSAVQIRPRALITTMYARLVLSDLFLHGIGGGKYDQLNDIIMARLFGIKPPEFLVISATYAPWGLSVPAPSVSANDIKQRIRQTYFHPEAFADRADLPTALIDEKADFLKRVPMRGVKRSWHQRLSEINHTLGQALQDERHQLQQRYREVLQIEADRRMLASREYSFCLYGLSDMQSTFDAMA